MSDWVARIDNNLIAIAVLLILLAASLRRRDLGRSQHRRFVFFLSLTIGLTALDTLAHLSQILPQGFPPEVVKLLFYLVYVATPLFGLFWLHYVTVQVQPQQKRPFLFWWIGLPLYILHMALTTLTLGYGCYFVVDAAGRYDRGPRFYLAIGFALAFWFLSLLLLLARHQRLDERHSKALLLFPLPVLLGFVLQSFHGLPATIWISHALAMLLLFIHAESRDLHLDDLTGIYNRRHIRQSIRREIRRSRRRELPFAVLFIDLDGFKTINDTYGHAAGDKALIMTASLLRASLRRADKVGRVGGDEFYVVLRVSDEKTLKRICQRIRQRFDAHNRQKKTPWRLDFSLGAKLYDPKTQLEVEDFLQQVDEAMYANKTQRKQA